MMLKIILNTLFYVSSVLSFSQVKKTRKNIKLVTNENGKKITKKRYFLRRKKGTPNREYLNKNPPYRLCFFSKKVKKNTHFLIENSFVFF